LFGRRTTGIASNRSRATQVELAAHAVVVSLSYFSWVLPFGISMACNIRVGNQGSRELLAVDEHERGPRRSLGVYSVIAGD
jgi:hypothetical protein